MMTIFRRNSWPPAVCVCLHSTDAQSLLETQYPGTVLFTMLTSDMDSHSNNNNTTRSKQGVGRGIHVQQTVRKSGAVLSTSYDVPGWQARTPYF